MIHDLSFGLQYIDKSSGPVTIYCGQRAY